MGFLIDGQWHDGEQPQEPGRSGQFTRADCVFCNDRAALAASPAKRLKKI